MHREEAIQRILAERERQFDLPGSEFDLLHTPNDWLAIAAAYCLEAVSKRGRGTSTEEMTESVIKTCAILIAALEHIPHMESKGLFPKI